MAAPIYGTKGRSFGIKGNVKASGVGSSTTWATLTGNAACIITGYTANQSPQGVAQSIDQSGYLVAEAIPYVQFDLSVTFEFASTNTTYGPADTLAMPTIGDKIELENMGNTELDGVYQYVGGSVTGSNSGMKTGTMNLRAISNGSDLTAANKVALAALTAS